MRKILGLILVFASFIFLVGCKNEAVDLMALLNEIEIGYSEGDNALNVRNDFSFPEEIKGYKIEWTSNNQALSIKDNNKGLVTRETDNVSVTLTASIVHKKDKEYKFFNLVIIKAEIFYQIQFYDGLELVSEISVLENTKVSEISAPSKEGYNFIGWYLNDFLYNFDTLVNSNLKLIATYQEEVTYNVSISYTDDLKEKQTIDIINGELLEEFIPEEFTDYEFKGIYDLDTGLEFDFSKEINQTTNLIVKYEKLVKHEVTIKYTDNLKAEEIISVLTNSKLSEIIAEEFTDYKFIGIFNILTMEEIDFNDLITDDLIILVQYEKIIKHTVHVIYNDDLDTDEDFFIISGMTLDELDIPIKTGYKFRGYYDLETEKLFDFSKEIYKDYQLFAYFILDVDYQVNISYEDGSEELIMVPNGDLLTPLKDLVKEGYIFLGYYDFETGLKFDFNSAVEEDITLVPKFEKEVYDERIIREDFEDLAWFKDNGGNFSEYSDFEYDLGKYNWNIINGRIDLGMREGGNAITIAGKGNDLGVAGLGRIESQVFKDGISYLEFEARLPFSPESSYPQRNGKDTASIVTITVRINDEVVQKFKFKDNKEANKGTKFILDNLDFGGSYKVAIDVSSGHRLTVDNILIKSNPNGTPPEEPVIPDDSERNIIDFENTNFDFSREEQQMNFAGIDFLVKEVQTLQTHKEKEKDYMKPVHGNKIARFRGAAHHIESTLVSYMASVERFDLSIISFDARLFGSNGYFSIDSELNIYIMRDNYWEIVESLSLMEDFETFNIPVNAENVRFKIEVVYGTVNIDNIKF